MKKSLWIYNITKYDVSISDLAVTVPAFGHIDLLKIPYITNDAINKSIESGSLFKRRHILKFGGEPVKQIKEPILVSNLPMERPHKGGFTVIPETFDDSQIIAQNQDDMEYIENLLKEEEQEEKLKK